MAPLRKRTRQTKAWRGKHRRAILRKCTSKPIPLVNGSAQGYVPIANIRAKLSPSVDMYSTAASTHCATGLLQNILNYRCCDVPVMSRKPMTGRRTKWSRTETQSYPGEAADHTIGCAERNYRDAQKTQRYLQCWCGGTARGSKRCRLASRPPNYWRQKPQAI